MAHNAPLLTDTRSPYYCCITAYQHRIADIGITILSVVMLALSIYLTCTLAIIINSATPPFEYAELTTAMLFIFYCTAAVAVANCYGLHVLNQHPIERDALPHRPARILFSGVLASYILYVFPIASTTAGSVFIQVAPPCPPHAHTNEGGLLPSNDDLLDPCLGKMDTQAGWNMIMPIFASLILCILYAGYRIYQNCCNTHQENTRVTETLPAP